jgi:hypothetical protein
MHTGDMEELVREDAGEGHLEEALPGLGMVCGQKLRAEIETPLKGGPPVLLQWIEQKRHGRAGPEIPCGLRGQGHGHPVQPDNQPAREFDDIPVLYCIKPGTGVHDRFLNNSNRQPAAVRECEHLLQ